MQFVLLRVAALAAAILMAGCGSKGSTSHSEATLRPIYVLVHGAWMGKNSWERVATLLKKDGAEVILVELPAHGADPTPAEQATLTAYVDAIVRAIGPRTNVVLAGHSFGGIVATATAEKIPQAIGKLVYVAAYLPRNGESSYMLSSNPAGASSLVGKYWQQADPAKYTPASIRSDGLVATFCGDCDEAAKAAIVSMHREEPVPPLATPVAITAERAGKIPRYYVATANDNAIPYNLQRLMLANTPVRQVVTLDTSHVPMLSMPGQVADALRQFAGE